MRQPFFTFVNWLLIRYGRKPPEIGSGLPQIYKDGERVFDARLKQRFPPGSQESALIVELRRQGFKVAPEVDRPFATYSDNRFPVRSVWNVGWKVDDGRISEIWGVYGGVGP